MNLPVILFLLGIIILLVSADEFVKQASLFSVRFRLSPLIIGTTIVAVGTSLPELAVSMISSSKGDAGLALGNIVGSNIVNVLLVLGLATIFGRIRVGTTKTQRNAWLATAVTLLFILFHARWPPLVSGMLLLIIFAVFSFTEIEWGIEGRIKEDVLKIKEFLRIRKKGNGWLFLLSLLGVVGGGYLTVVNAESLAKLFGLTTTVFGLSATAIATSLPEISVTLISEEKGQEKLALGNIIGSNICNLTLIGGFLAFFPKTQPLDPKIWGFLLVTALLNLLIITRFKGRVIPRWVGLGLVMIFLIYLKVLTLP